MVNFVICEDEIIFVRMFEKIISKCMVAHDINYNVHIFDGYGSDFENYIKRSSAFNIYLLDIKTKCGTGINAARMIRERYHDWTSMIMIITSYAEYKYEALTKRLMLIDFINKLDRCEEKIFNAINIAIKNYDERPNMLTYEYHKTFYRINLKDIMLIEKEPESGRCIVHTSDNEYIIPKSLNTIEKMLDKRFLRVHKSAIVNVDNIKKIDPILNKMTFKNEKTSCLLARGKKRELLECIGNDR